MCRAPLEALWLHGGAVVSAKFSKPLPTGLSNIWPLLLLLLAALSIRYSARRNRFLAYKRRDHVKEAPPTVPYIFPLLGSLPISYLRNPSGFVLNPSNFFQRPYPVRVKILTYEFYVIQGAENIKALFKNSWACTSIPFVKFALGYAFGLPAKTLSLYDKDDSGGGHVPHPDSTVDARNRIDYRDHQSLVRFLEGKGLMPFWKRFVDDITRRLHSTHLRLGSDWQHYPDLMQIVSDVGTVSIVNSLCGPYLLKLNPGFLQDFWEFDRNLQTYLQGVPWIFAPRAYASRNRVLNAVKVWQAHARENFTHAAVGEDGDDPFWGSSFFRERHAIFLEMDGFDHAAIASADFGAIWAVRNAVTAASWTVFEIYRDSKLLAEVRAEVDSCVLNSADGGIQFDVDQLLRSPVLQAVYAETLRLRMHFYIIRMPDRVDMEIRDWVIPRRKVVVTCTTTAHMDSVAWNTGLDNEHPVNEFWAGRFLNYPECSDTTRDAAATPTFSTKGLEGSWIPYGGGPRQCPGRHFAKRQILLTAALMVTLFDCDVLEEGSVMKEDLSLKDFGGGVSHPAGKVPVRMRQRKKDGV